MAYKTIFVLCTWLGAIFQAQAVLDFGDLMVLGMVDPGLHPTSLFEEEASGAAQCRTVSPRAFRKGLAVLVARVALPHPAPTDSRVDYGVRVALVARSGLDQSRHASSTVRIGRNQWIMPWHDGQTGRRSVIGLTSRSPSASG